MVEILICDDDKDFLVFEEKTVWEVVTRYQKKIWMETYQSVIMTLV